MPDDTCYFLVEAVACLGEGGEWELRRRAFGGTVTFYGRRRCADGSLNTSHESIPIGDFIDLYPGGRFRFNLEANSIEANASAGALIDGSPARTKEEEEERARALDALLKTTPVEQLQTAFAEFAHLATESWGWGEVKIAKREVDALAKSLAGREVTKAKAETDCRKWMCEKIATNRDRPETKSLCRTAAAQKFGIGVRAFDRAWDAAIRETGAAAWSRAGPKTRA